jgi:hypothetical protein
MKPNSRESLISYALKQLGAPLIEINVERSQLDNLLDDTIQLYQERVYDGVEDVYLKYVITQTDIDNSCNNTPVANTNGLSFVENKNYLLLPDHIIGVTQVLNTNYGGYTDMFGRTAEFYMHDKFNFFGNAIIDLTDIYIMRETIQNTKNLLNPENNIEFNYSSGRLYLQFNIANMLGQYIVIHCQRAIDPNQFNKIYNNRFVKEYFTILAEEQWGKNLSKFSNISLPGNVMFNADKILASATQKKAEFLAKMQAEWETPSHFFVG